MARASVDDPQDAFQLVRMDGDAIASDPLKLADEANTIGLFGGRRAIRVSPTSKPLLAALEPLAGNLWLAALLIGGVVVWQAIQLKRLRVEKHREGSDLSK